MQTKQILPLSIITIKIYIYIYIYICMYIVNHSKVLQQLDSRNIAMCSGIPNGTNWLSSLQWPLPPEADAIITCKLLAISLLLLALI